MAEENKKLIDKLEKKNNSLTEQVNHEKEEKKELKR